MITTTTVWTVKAGDKLPAIAAKVYGDPRPVSYTHLTLPPSDLV